MMKVRAILFTVLVLLALVIIGVRIRAGSPFESDILQLLPKHERSATVNAAIREFIRRAGQPVGILITHPDRAAARRAGTIARERLAASAAFAEVEASLTHRPEEILHDLYFPHRVGMMPPATAALLAAPDAPRRLRENLERVLHAPLGGVMLSGIARDPLLLFPSFLATLPRPASSLELDDGLLTLSGGAGVTIVLPTMLRGSAFSRAVQEQALAELTALAAQIEGAEPGVTVTHQGVLRIAASLAEAAERDVSIIGAGSTIATIALVYGVFLSTIPVLLSMLMIGTGCILALGGALLVFPSVHLITLGFGASLIGVCADYSFHFFCHQAATPDRSAREILREIGPGLTVAFWTSVLGYIGLLLVPFPGLNQMAFFAVVGMTGAFLTVICWFPRLGSRMRSEAAPRFNRLAHGCLDWTSTPRARRSALIALLFAAPLLVYGWVRATVSDDVRLLQRPDESLRVEEQQFRVSMGAPDVTRFLVIRGGSEQALLEREEELHPRLAALVRDGHVADWQAVSRWVPSRSRQTGNRAALAAFLTARGTELRTELAATGLTEGALEGVFALPAADAPVFTPGEWLASPLAPSARHLWLGELSSGEFASLITFTGITDPGAIRALQSDSVTFIDQAGDASALLARYRHTATIAIALCYGIIFLVLVYRYGLRHGLLGLTPALLAVLCTVAGQGLLGQPINLFTILANLIVLGLAIDYAVFRLEGMNHAGPTNMAIALSALSTVCSFGFLAFSSTPVLRAFGTSLLIGTLVAMLGVSLLVTTSSRRVS